MSITKTVSAALTASLFAFSAFAGERFEIPALGFSIIAPDGWVNRTDRVIAAGLDTPPIIPAEKRLFVEHYSGDTVLALGEARGQQDTYGASISVVVIDGRFVDPKAQLELLVPSARDSTHHFRQIIPPTEINIGGNIGAMMKYFQIYSVANGEMIIPTHSWLYLAPNMDHGFMITMGVKDTAPAEVQDAMEAAIKTIEFR